MNTLNELGQMIKENLEEKGHLKNIFLEIINQIRQDLNEKVTHILVGQGQNKQEQNKLKGKNAVVNELIREYLQFNDYQHTFDVFVEEANCSRHENVDRRYLTKYLKILEDKNTQEIPLIYGLAFGQKKLLTQEFHQTYHDDQPRYVTSSKIPSEQNQQRQIYQQIFNMEQPNAIVYE